MVKYGLYSDSKPGYSSMVKYGLYSDSKPDTSTFKTSFYSLKKQVSDSNQLAKYHKKHQLPNLWKLETVIEREHLCCYRRVRCYRVTNLNYI